MSRVTHLNESRHTSEASSCGVHVCLCMCVFVRLRGLAGVWGQRTCECRWVGVRGGICVLGCVCVGGEQGVGGVGGVIRV